VDCPASVLRYVARTGQLLMLDNVAHDTRFAGDLYLQQTQPATILCLPLQHQSRVTALLYLEHRELADVFSVERLAATRLIAAEAAVALVNAQLYQDMKDEVEKRRQAEVQLRDALAQVANLKDQLAAENVYLREEIESEHNVEHIVGSSPALRQVLQQVELVAATEANVLVLGETGTGKELVARALHELSPRKARPLIKVNCAALPASLIESELFGHEKGAFTGALRKKLGRFELADQGTLFLDEIGELPLDLQTKLLRVLQEEKFERLGSGQTFKVDVRVVAATNRDLKKAVETGAFRSDLYYRLNVFPLHLPPLRERGEDIPLLVWYFVHKHQSKVGKTIQGIPAHSMDALQAYTWPGNVRELENLVERALILSRGETLIFDRNLLPATPVPTPSAAKDSSAQGSLQAIEREHIVAVLEQSGWKIDGAGHAAERLGLKPSTLRFRMKKLGIERP
jgi:transcriptional regulator with GAF, ATPase, and Fis domain